MRVVADRPEMRAARAFLHVESVSLSFAGVRALTDIDFTIEQGEICGLVGPNGAGKSSLLNVLSGVYRADQGRVLLEGVPLPPAEPREAAVRGIARTFQNLALFKKMSVIDNVITGETLRKHASLFAQALSLPRARQDERDRRMRAEAMLVRLALAAYRDVVVGTLPYGLQKRVELARALVAAPKLLLLDEPMAGMTFAEKEAMCEILVSVHRELGTTVLLIEHDMGVVMDLSERVVVLDYGRLIKVGSPSEVQDDRRVIEAYLGVPS